MALSSSIFLGAQLAHPSKLTAASPLENLSKKPLVFAMSADAGKRKQSPVRTLLSGGVAGCMSRTFTAPLDVTKILLQVQSDSADKAYYGSFGQAMKRVYQEEGLKGLWKGNNVACLRLGPYSAVKYLTYEETAFMFRDPQTGQTAGGRKAIAGSMAGVAAVITTYPLDLIKTRLTVQKEGKTADGKVLKKTYNGIWDCFRKVYRDEGFTALYKGMGTTIVGVIPFEGVQFWFYNYVRDVREEQKKKNGQRLEAFDFLALGCLAGAVAQTFAYPFDLVRKRMMAQSKAEGMLGERYSGMTNAFMTIIREEGPLGLYKGTVPNLLKVCPYAAIMWLSYEMMNRLFKWMDTRK